MKAMLDYDAIDSLTAVELPDRNLLQTCALIADSFNNWELISVDNAAVALQACNVASGNAIAIPVSVLTIFNFQIVQQSVDTSYECEVTNLAVFNSAFGITG
jgi:hypothetical protein